MENLIVKILSELTKHFLVIIFIFLAAVYGLFLDQGVVSLVFASLAIGILIGQETPK